MTARSVVAIAPLGLAQVGQCECPLLVISGHCKAHPRCLLYPQEQPRSSSVSMSAKCHKRTSRSESRELGACIPCGSADLFQRREGRWREDLVADARHDGSVALAVVADFVPSRIILECRPPHLAICSGGSGEAEAQ